MINNTTQPDTITIKKVYRFISKLSSEYLLLLDDNEGFIINDHGTITLEWRNDNGVVSVEFGRSSHNGYALILGEKHILIDSNVLNSDFISKVHTLLNMLAN